MSLFVAGAVCVLLAAGCGGDQGIPGSRLSAATASRLAAASDAVAVALAGGDGCLAGRRASGLAASVETAITAGRVPLALMPELRQRVRALRAAIHCVPSPPPAPLQPTTTVSTGPPGGGGKHDEQGHGRHGEGGKGKGGGEG